MTKYYIGWDVGAWHCKKDSKSKDAFAILNGQRELVGKLWETNGEKDLKSIILAAVNKDETERTSFLIQQIFSLCGAQEKYNKEYSFCIAIDTPLGWTKSFRGLLTMWSSGKYEELTLEEMGSKNNNPILTRETEKRFDKSLSVIQDQIGSQSTKAMYLLSSFKPNRKSTGIWKTTSPNLTIIETYPAPCMRSLAFIEHMKGITPDKIQISSSDKFDALVCANLAWCFENPPTTTLPSVQIDSPHPNNDPAEGWIFAPQENILDSNFGISYPKLIGNKGLSVLLSEIQIAIVLSAKETAWEKNKNQQLKEAKANNKAEEDANCDERFTRQLEVINKWANTNKQLFASLSANDWAKKFETLHPDWFKKGTESTKAKKGKKDGKYHSENNRAEFKRFLETTINMLQQGNP